MSRSVKDGPGGHRRNRWSCRELWSRRCPPVNGSRTGRWAKRVTHRFERRLGKLAAMEGLLEYSCQ